jgi:hypothetical protein
MMKMFNIHYNGDIPFHVEINGNKIDIFSDNHTTPILTQNARTIFVGESPKNKMTTFSGGYGPEFLGNSILLELEDNEYEFIGKNIFSFTPLANIIHFVSPVGNNDVPYPYAIDVEGNIYLLMEHVVLKGGGGEDDDPYSYYYHNSLMGNFYVENECYKLNYHAFPEKNYDRITNDLGKPVYVMDPHNNKTVLTKEDYISHVNEFGRRLSFQPMKNVHVLF